jgi:hypothetical protein
MPAYVAAGSTPQNITFTATPNTQAPNGTYSWVEIPSTAGEYMFDSLSTETAASVARVPRRVGNTQVQCTYTFDLLPGAS